MAAAADPDVAALLQQHMDEDKWTEAKQLFHRHNINDVADELIPILVVRARDKAAQGMLGPNVNALAALGELLGLAAQRGSPKVNLMALLGAVDGKREDPLVFRLCVYPLVGLMPRLEPGPKRALLWQDVLSLMVRWLHVQEIENDKEDAVAAMDFGCFVANTLLDFVSMKGLSDQEKLLLRNTFLHILESPCSRVELVRPDEKDRALEVDTLRVAAAVLPLMGEDDTLRLLTMPTTSFETEQDVVRFPSKTGLLMLLALHMQGHPEVESVLPLCYRWPHVAKVTLGATDLEQLRGDMPLKMLIAIHKILHNMGHERVTSQLFTSAEMVRFMTHAVSLLSFSQFTDVRREAMQVVDVVGRQMEPPAKAMFFRFVHSKAQHSGLRAWVIGKVKDEALAAVKAQKDGHPVNGAFIGHNLVSQLRSFFCFPKDANSADLFQWGEEAMSALNGMYVLVRNAEALELADYEAEFRQDYLKPLYKMIADTKLVLQSTLENSNISKEEKKAAEMGRAKLDLIECSYHQFWD